MLVKLRTFLSNLLLLECCLFEALTVGPKWACYILKLNYMCSVRSSQPCFPSSRLSFFLRDSLKMQLPASPAQEYFLFSIQCTFWESLNCDCRVVSCRHTCTNFSYITFVLNISAVYMYQIRICYFLIFHRIKLQNHVMVEVWRDLGVHLAQPPAQAGPPRAGCSGLCPVRFWVSQGCRVHHLFMWKKSNLSFYGTCVLVEKLGYI